MSPIYAQTVLDVQDRVLEVKEIRETFGSSTKKIVLKLSPHSPKKFKLNVEYLYRFKSEKLSGAYVGANGGLVLTTQPELSEIYTGKNTLAFDISDSTVMNGDEVELLVEISKPNKDIHGIKVDVSVVNSSTNTLESGKRLLGLLSRNYDLVSNCP